MDHKTGQCVSVGLGQLTDGLIKNGQTVVVILDFYNKQKKRSKRKTHTQVI